MTIERTARTPTGAASDPRSLAGRGVTAQMLVELTRVFNLLTYVWYRARRVSRSVPATDLQLESTALRRALLLAPEVEPRHT